MQRRTKVEAGVAGLTLARGAAAAALWVRRGKSSRR